jgi:hypothetical protein
VRRDAALKTLCIISGTIDYAFDPHNPAPTVGGAISSGEPVMHAGAFDPSAVALRSDTRNGIGDPYAINATADHQHVENFGQSGKPSGVHLSLFWRCASRNIDPQGVHCPIPMVRCARGGARRVKIRITSNGLSLGVPRFVPYTGPSSHMGLPQRINFAECQTRLIHVMIDILRQMSHDVLSFNETRRSD